ncbi:unnamed protein product [Closterium sp. NIES-53]
MLPPLNAPSLTCSLAHMLPPLNAPSLTCSFPHMLPPLNAPSLTCSLPHMLPPSHAARTMIAAAAGKAPRSHASSCPPSPPVHHRWASRVGITGGHHGWASRVGITGGHHGWASRRCRPTPCATRPVASAVERKTAMPPPRKLPSALAFPPSPHCPLSRTPLPSPQQASRLGITTVVSTDSLRHMMRGFSSRISSLQIVSLSYILSLPPLPPSRFPPLHCRRPGWASRQWCRPIRCAT